jgi:hypothetical protein
MPAPPPAANWGYSTAIPGQIPNGPVPNAVPAAQASPQTVSFPNQMGSPKLPPGMPPGTPAGMAPGMPGAFPTNGPALGQQPPPYAAAGPERLPPRLGGVPPAELPECLKAFGADTQIIRIPIRLGPGDVANFAPDDVILHDNDIVFIESRETEIFYTGGLLGGGQYSLPRDYDLDVLGAIAIASGRQAAGGSGAGVGSRIGGIAAINQDISVSASDVVILRQLPDGNQVPIRVCLQQAMRDPQERILIQPGDYIILQYTRCEAIAAFIERNLLAGSFIGLATAQFQSNNSSGGK